MGAWYEAELAATADDANEMAKQLQRLAAAKGPDVAAEALAEVVPDTANALAQLAGALAFLVREKGGKDATEARDAADRLLAHVAFLRSALEDRTEKGQERRAEREAVHAGDLRGAAREHAAQLTVAIGAIVKGRGRDEEMLDVARRAAEDLLEAVPVLWVGRTIVVKKGEEQDPGVVVEEAQRVLEFLGHWLA